MKKRILVLILVAVLALSLAACGEKPASNGGGDEGWKFDRPVEFTVNFGPGSGTDTTIRAWLPHIEKELGIKTNINNVEGAGGIKGAEHFNTQPADGYNFSMYTPSHVIAGVDETANFDILEDTIPVVCLVQDTNMIVAGTHVPYSNMKELIEYCKENPDKKPTLGMMSINGIDGAAAAQLQEEAGIELNFIPYESGAEANAAVMGGHTDMVLASPSDLEAYIESGDMKPIVVLAEQRASTLPDVECSGELGYDAYIGPWRGIVAKKGTPQEAIDALEAAAIAVNDNEEWVAWKESVALNDRPAFRDSKAFKELWDDYYEIMKKLRGK